MDFFKKKWVRIVAWVVLFVDVAVLLLGGITQAEIGDGVKLVAEAIALVSAVIAFIAGHSALKDLNAKLEAKPKA